MQLNVTLGNLDETLRCAALTDQSVLEKSILPPADKSILPSADKSILPSANKSIISNADKSMIPIDGSPTNDIANETLSSGKLVLDIAEVIFCMNKRATDGKLSY